MNVDDIKWDKDNNIMFVFGKMSISFTGNVEEIKKLVDINYDKFIHIGDKISVNLRNVIAIYYRKEDKK